MDDINIGDNFDGPEARRAMRRRHVELAIRMQAIASAALAEWECKIAAGEPLNVSAQDAKALLDAGRELERESCDGDDDSPKKPN